MEKDLSKIQVRKDTYLYTVDVILAGFDIVLYSAILRISALWTVYCVVLPAMYLSCKYF